MQTNTGRWPRCHPIHTAVQQCSRYTLHKHTAVQQCSSCTMHKHTAVQQRTHPAAQRQPHPAPQQRPHPAARLRLHPAARQQLHQESRQRTFGWILQWCTQPTHHSTIPNMPPMMSCSHRPSKACCGDGCCELVQAAPVDPIPLSAIESKWYTRANGKSSKHRMEGCIYSRKRYISPIGQFLWNVGSEGRYASHSRVMSTWPDRLVSDRAIEKTWRSWLLIHTRYLHILRERHGWVTTWCWVVGRRQRASKDIYIYIYIYVYMYIYIYVQNGIGHRQHLESFMHSTWFWGDVCIYVYTYIYMYIYICMNVSTHIYIYNYIYINI